MSKKEFQSTFEREMADEDFCQKFEGEYKEFLLSELIVELMEEQSISVRKLAKAVELSPTVIQDIRSGKRSNLTIINASKILKRLGSDLAIKRGDKYIPLID